MFLKIWDEFCIFIAGNTQLGRRLEVAAHMIARIAKQIFNWILRGKAL